MIATIPRLIRKARADRSQKDFAFKLGVSQGTLSKYERGQINPPAGVIEYCMRVVNTTQMEDAPTADDLAEKIRRELGREEHAEFRLSISRLIDGIAGAASSGYAARTESR